MSLLDIIAAVLSVEVVLLIPAAAYVMSVYATSRSRGDGEVPFLYTLIAGQSVAIGVCGGALSLILFFYLTRQALPFSGILLGLMLIVLLSAPLLVAAAIWHLRRER